MSPTTERVELVLRCKWCRCAPLLVVSGLVVDSVKWKCPKCHLEQTA